MPTWLSSTLNKSAATLNGDEVIRVVDDPSGTPVSAKTTIDDLKDYVSTNISAPYLTEAEASGLYQPLDADLTTLGAGGAAARAFLGLGTSDTPQFTGVNLGNASDTTLSRYAAGIPGVEGWPLESRGGAFSGHATVVSRYRSMTSWPVGLAWQTNEDRLWCFEAVMPSHGPSTTSAQLGSRVECWYTEDNGNTKLGRRTIYSDSVQRPLAGSAFGNMASGRIGGIVCVSDDATTVTTRNIYFVYSDDNCATWTWVALTGLTIDHFVYGMLMPLPTAYGGDNTNGFAVITYAGTTAAKIIKTTDNGANWSEATLKTGDGTLANPQEPSLVFTDSGAIMFARAGGSGNLFAAKSTDLSTWGAWADTGVALGENPVHAVVDADDFVHVAVCDRDDFTAAVNENVVRTYRIAGSALYANLTALGSVTPKFEWNLGYRGIGYFQSLLVGSEWYHFVKARESASTANGASADLVLITTTPRPSPSLTPMLPPRQLIHNPAFDLWNNGTSFLNQTATAALADRWTYFPSGATADITRVTLTEVQRLSFPHRPRYGLKLDTIGAGNVHSDFVGIHQYFYGEQFYDLLAVLQGRQEIDCIVYGIGTPIPTARVSIYIDYGAGGSTDVSVNATLTTAYTANDGAYVQTCRVDVPIIGNPTIGTAPFIRIVLDCNASATAFAATIVGIFAYAGIAPDEPVAPSSIENAIQCALADDGTDTAGTITFHRPLAADSLTLDTDLPLTQGGTGASTARGAAANLGSWHVLSQSSVAVPVPNAALTTEQTYVTVAVPAGAMGANGLLRITTVWTYTNSANNKTMRVRFGGTSGTQYTSATSTTTASLRTQCQIGNRNATNSQVGGSIVSAGFGTSTGANQTSAVDTAASVDLVISGQTASAGETLTLESYMVELYYAA